MKISGFNSLNTIKTNEIKDVLSKLNIGDNIKVEVVSLDNNEITLRLPNGETINVTVTFPLEAMPGDFIELSLKDKTDSQVFFQTKLVSTEQGIQKQLENILISLNMTPDNRNVEIGKEMIKQSMPINKENLIEIVNTMNKLNIGIEKSVFMISNNINEVENGAQILDDLASNKNVIGDIIQTLSNNLSNENKDVVSKVINQYNFIATAKNIEQEVKNSFEIIKNFENNLKNVQNDYATNNGIVNDSNTQNLAKNIVSQILNLSVIYNDDNEKMITNNKITINQLDELIKNIEDKTQTKEVSNFINKNVDVKEKILSFINDKESLNKFILEYKDKNIFLKNDIDTKDLNLKLKEFLKLPSLDKGAGIESKINVNKVYNDLLTKLNIIEHNATEGNFVNNEAILNTTGQIKNNINVINNVNNMFYYFQVPINMKNNESHMELYISKNNKKSSKIDSNNVSLYISLDTKKLGVVDTLINVNYKKINFDFKLQSNQIIDYIKKNQSILVKLIESKGYTINKIDYSINTKRSNILNVDMNSEDDIVMKSRLDVKI